LRTTDTRKTSSPASRTRRRRTNTSVMEVVVPIKKAAEFLKLGRSSVYRLTREGLLDKVKLAGRTWILLSSITQLREARGVKL
jgi:transposase-like protein